MIARETLKLTGLCVAIGVALLAEAFGALPGMERNTLDHDTRRAAPNFFHAQHEAHAERGGNTHPMG